MIKVKVEVASNEELMRSGGHKRNISINLTEKKRERHRLACFSGGRRRKADIEDGYFRMEKFEGQPFENFCTMTISQLVLITMFRFVICL